ncbi:MAG: pilus assembly protein PilM, partial [Candidatus Omnitrophica bacterium]|nr:pilus assembly protein PilM [Candidatus Omnitrophota bacterium]
MKFEQVKPNYCLDRLKRLSHGITSQFQQFNLRDSFDKIQGQIFSKKKTGAVKSDIASLGCDYGLSKILIVEIQKSNSGIKMTHFSRIDRSEDKRKAAEEIKQCFEQGGFTTTKVRIAVKGQGVIARFIQFPKMKPEDLKSALSFEAEKYIPFKFNEVLIDY